MLAAADPFDPVLLLPADLAVRARDAWVAGHRVPQRSRWGRRRPEALIEHGEQFIGPDVTAESCDASSHGLNHCREARRLPLRRLRFPLPEVARVFHGLPIDGRPIDRWLVG